MMLLGMLSNYNKYESRNPYLAYMQKCKQAKPLEVSFTKKKIMGVNRR